ncbi:MAG TPA: HAD-IC family P-type ATPase, partial [Candidatus Galloscillospira excrementipullorum]|nr:HAD-IC family P-type ATPase [Candidatus Galloscillospira excrementipullorum]
MMMHQEHKSCGCGHEHGHKGCGCGHDHRHEHGDCGCKGNGHTKACACGHDHGTSPAQKADSTGCGCGKHHGEDDSGGGGDDASGHLHPTPAGGNAACSKQEPAGACHDEIMQQKEHCGCGHDHDHDHGHGHGRRHGFVLEHSCGCGHDHGHSHGFELEHSCGCGHDHGHSHGGARFPWPVAVAVPLFVAGLLLEDMYSTAALLAAYVLAGFAPIWAAVKNAVRGNLFDENFLMTIASLGAVVIGEYPEACAVMLLYRLGEYLQNRAVDSSMRSIDALLELRPERARLLENGEERDVNADRLRPGDLIVVRPGDKVAADGVVREGGSYLDLSALTGESAPVAVSVGDTVLSGGINRDGLLTVEVTHAADASTAARVIRLVEQASREKAPTENFITKFSRWYTPAVCALAALLVVILGGFGIQSWGDAFYNACVLLVVSCPCALAISVPLGFFAGLGAASRRGVLFKGGNYLEALGEVKHFVVDKTGTLTTGKLRVETVEPAGTDKQHLLETAAAAEAS